jgi:molybdenum-dependent DNA-binding transcriptional regulator ModE
MRHTSPDPRSPRPGADYRWTDNKAFAFLQALAQHGKVAVAARAVGMTRQSAYRLKRRVPELADPWERARAIGQRRRRAASRKASPCAPQGDTSEFAR